MAPRLFCVALFSASFLLTMPSAHCEAGASKSDVKSKKVSEKKRGESDLFLVLEETLLNNKDIIGARHSLMGAHDEYNVESAGFKPTISSEVGYDFSNSRHWNSHSPQRYSNVGDFGSTKKVGIALRQNIFRGGADSGAVSKVTADIKSQWSEYESLKQRVLAQVCTLYFEILAKQKEIEHLKSFKESRASTLQVVTEMQQTGAEKYVSVMQAKASYAETEGLLAKAEAELETMCAKFEEVTGVKVPTRLTPPEKLFDVDMNESQARDIALKRNPKIVASVSKLAAAREALKKPNAHMYPSIDLIYRYDQSLDTATKMEDSMVTPNSNRGHTFGVSMTIPIYDAGVGRAKARQASEASVRAAVEKEKAIEETMYEIAKVWAEIKAAKSHIVSAAVAVEAREVALHDTEEEYKAGVKIMNDVLEAQQKLFEAQSTMVSAQKAYFVSQCSALEILGRMTTKYLKIRGDGFDYRAHFEKTKRKI